MVFRNPTPMDTNITKNKKGFKVCLITIGVLLTLVAVATLTINTYLLIYINQITTSKSTSTSTSTSKNNFDLLSKSVFHPYL
jgi:hypothetical protein